MKGSARVEYLLISPAQLNLYPGRRALCSQASDAAHDDFIGWLTQQSRGVVCLAKARLQALHLSLTRREQPSAQRELEPLRY